MVSRNRVVVLIDMDCFYCQVEDKLNPTLKGKPIAVVQYNAWQGGGIIAVNYPARDEGVTRHMRGFEAKKKCPSINLVSVPEVRGKADLTKYRDAGKEVAAVLATFTPLLQRASVDEAYLDITEQVEKRIHNLSSLTIDNLKNTHVVGSELDDFIHNAITNSEFSMNNLRLVVGGLITEEMRYEVFKQTGYKCSAGIAHNKILAKLVCSLHKPNKQTIMPQEGIEHLFKTTKISKVTGFGGKFGQALCDDFHVTFMNELAMVSEKDLLQKFDDKTAKFVYNIARGVDLEPVTPKLISKSIACCKNFPGKSALTTNKDVRHWLDELAAEMEERLRKDLLENNRKAKQVIVNFSQEINRKDVSSSRTHPLASYCSKKIAHNAFELIKKYCQRSDGSFVVKFLGLSAGHFEDVSKVREITSFFQTGQVKDQNIKQKSENKTIASNVVDSDNNVENIYQQLTQELHENVHELIFYDDSYRIKPTDDFSDCEDYSGNAEEKPASSFFAKYFDYNRNSPTNVNISEVDCKEDFNNSDNAQNETSEELHEICAECHKNIPSSELLSHMDYHFALKLSKSQSIGQKSVTTDSKAKGKEKRGKRKAEIAKSNSLLTFFNKKQEIDESADTELCIECNRKIKVEEMCCHMDYHAAKKIHLELNPVSTTERPRVSPPKKKPNKTKSQSTNRSIASFFKPS